MCGCSKGEGGYSQPPAPHRFWARVVRRAFWMHGVYHDSLTSALECHLLTMHIQSQLLRVVGFSDY